MKKLMLITMVSILLFACGGGGDGDGNGGGGGNVTPPSAATLVFPENNTECNEGTINSETESTVNFRWNAAANTDTYVVILRNLENNQIINRSTAETNLDIRILRGKPYSWQVESRAGGTTQTARSDTFRFYNAGAPVESFAPFPAAAVSPGIGETVNGTSGSITLRWSGSDVDDDITEYEIYFDTANPPISLAATQSGTTLDVNVVDNTTYYWQVVTRDSEGNTSTSELFQFKTSSSSF
jgi:hypothetical protein